MKSGFTLIELVVSLAIAAIVGTALTALLSQTATYQGIVERKTSIYTRASIVLHQFEKDVMGTCMPIQNSMQKKQDIKEQKPASAHVEKESSAVKKEPIKPIEHVFYVEQSKEKFKLFTCITSNPLQVYWSKQVGKAKPKSARVVYALAPDPNNKESFMLMRQEDGNLDLNAYTGKHDAGIRAYEMVDGVKSLSLHFSVFQYQESPQKDQKKSTHSHERTLEERDQWDWPAPQKEGEKKESSESPFPHFVTLTIELWDELYERSTEFVYTIPVMVDATQEKKEDSKKVESAPNARKEPETQKSAAQSSSSPYVSFAPQRPQVQRSIWS